MYNVGINQELLNNVEQPEAQILDWADFSHDTVATLSPDILLACDCVYDIDEFPALMGIIGAFFTFPDTPKSNRVDRVAYFATTLRNEATLSTFLSHLDQYSIHFTNITSETAPCSHFEYPNAESIRLYRLSTSN